MPNHCEQDLFIYGDADTLQNFKEFAKEEKRGELLLLSATKFVPYPSDKIYTLDLDNNSESLIYQLIELKLANVAPAAEPLTQSNDDRLTLFFNKLVKTPPEFDRTSNPINGSVNLWALAQPGAGNTMLDISLFTQKNSC